jgi:hypothetical protein
LLALLRPGFGQLDKGAIIVTTHNAKALGRITTVAWLITAIVTPVIATFIALPWRITLPTARLLLARLLLSGLLAHGFGQKPGVMLGVLQEVFGCDPVV